MNDDELEAMFRASLTDHASEAVPAADPVASAHAGARRRRRRVLGAVAGTSAIVLIAPAAVLAVTLGQGESNVADPGVPRGWRVESYNGIQLGVPETWGWGMTNNACQQPASPYVGRPVTGGFTCPLMSPTVAHVWFDSFEPVGSRKRETTVQVKGLTEFNITVADPDPVQRQRILDTIHPVNTDSNGCPEKPAKVPWDSQDPNLQNATNASVCVYFRTSASRYAASRVYLYYSTRVDKSVPGLVDAINSAGPGPRNLDLNLCVVMNGLSSIDLIVRSGDASTTYGISSNVCGGQRPGYDSGPDFHVLTKRSVAMWAVDGVPFYAQNGRAPNAIGHYLP